MKKLVVVFALSVCACGGGGDGLSSLVSVSEEDPGDRCTDGGQKIEYGVDVNGSGVLDNDEVSGTSYVCNGETGPAGEAGEAGETGADGAMGSDGAMGADGNDGAAGLNALIRTTAEPPGANCQAGGTFIEYGTDDDANGTLDDPEVDGGTYACNGVSAVLAGGGIQTNLSLAEVQEQGWSICSQTLYNQGPVELPAACTGTNLMMACREIATPDNLVVAAADSRAVVTQVDVGGSTEHHVSNGVGWYYTPNTYSWGFFRAGDGVSRSSCDTAAGTFPEERLCWHTGGVGGGYRCGTQTGLNGSADWEKLILHQ